MLRADVTKAGSDKTYAKAVVNTPASAPAVLSVLTTPLPYSSSASTPASGNSVTSEYSNSDSVTDSLASYGGLLEAAVASVKDAIATVYPSSSSSSASSIAASPTAG